MTSIVPHVLILLLLQPAASTEAIDAGFEKLAAADPHDPAARTGLLTPYRLQAR